MDFLPWKSKSLSRCSVVVPLEVPRTEMVSLQLLVDRHRNSGIELQLRKPGQALKRPERPLPVRKKFPKMVRIWGFWVAWIWCGFFGTEKKGLNRPTPVPEQNPRSFSRKSVQKSVPQNQESTASSNPSSLCACSLRCSELSSRTERPLANAQSL